MGICIRFQRIKKIKLWVVELDLIIFFLYYGVKNSNVNIEICSFNVWNCKNVIMI